jgi:hypothetical protein
VNPLDGISSHGNRNTLESKWTSHLEFEAARTRCFPIGSAGRAAYKRSHTEGRKLAGPSNRDHLGPRLSTVEARKQAKRLGNRVAGPQALISFESVDAKLTFVSELPLSMGVCQGDNAYVSDPALSIANDDRRSID